MFVIVKGPACFFSNQCTAPAAAAAADHMLLLHPHWLLLLPLLLPTTGDSL